METITVTTKNHETFSSVSNFFIDYYMAEASGEYVKVYLYLVRLLNSGRAVTVGDIADHFECTEKDICRAIRYWIKQKVLKLEYTTENGNKVLTGITMLSLTPKAPKNDSSSILSMLGVTEEELQDNTDVRSNDNESKLQAQNNTAVKEAYDDEEQDADIETAATVTIPKKVRYKAAFISSKQEDEDFSNLLYQTETYFGKPLTQTDINSLLYIYEELKFSPELLEYLVEYCVSIG